MTLKLPHPSTWIPAGLLYDDGQADWLAGREAAMEVSRKLLAAVLPTLAAAVLDDAADVVESYTEPPAVSGGQWLRGRAEGYRRGDVHKKVADALAAAGTEADSGPAATAAP